MVGTITKPEQTEMGAINSPYTGTSLGSGPQPTVPPSPIGDSMLNLESAIKNLESLVAQLDRRLDGVSVPGMPEKSTGSERVASPCALQGRIDDARDHVEAACGYLNSITNRLQL